MKIPSWLIRRLQTWAAMYQVRHPVDFIIGGTGDPYLFRWWVLPRNRLFNIYLHRVIRSDDDRALHDHPWPNASIIIAGAYHEHTILAGGVHRRVLRSAGSVVLRRSTAAHRLEVIPDLEPATTLFITGPRIREWGFHCAESGWVLWKTFVSKTDKGSVGRGCGEEDLG